MEEGRTPYNMFDSKGESGFAPTTRMSLRWLYHDFMGAMEKEGVLDEDWPKERLPEDMPLGLCLLGEEKYRRIVERLGKDEANAGIPAAEDGWGFYCNHNFGDNWELAIAPPEYLVANTADMPRIVEAEGHTPPDGVHGLDGYEDFIQAYDTGNVVNSDGVDLNRWARSNGWLPFEGMKKLRDHFDKPSTWKC